MIEVDLCSMTPEAISTTPAPSHVSAGTTQPTIAKTLNLHIQGAFEQVQQTLPTTSMPVSQHSSPRWKLPSTAMGGPCPTRVEDPLRLEGADSAVLMLMASSSQVPHHVAMPNNILISVLTCHSLSPPPVSKSLTVASIASTACFLI